MPKFRFPRPPDGATIVEMDPPVRVSCEWPISASFKPQIEGWAVAWWGGADGLTLVRPDEGGEAWVTSASVVRL